MYVTFMCTCNSYVQIYAVQCSDEMIFFLASGAESVCHSCDAALINTALLFKA